MNVTVTAKPICNFDFCIANLCRAQLQKGYRYSSEEQQYSGLESEKISQLTEQLSSREL